jgi:hypothetical protein
MHGMRWGREAQQCIVGGGSLSRSEMGSISVDFNILRSDGFTVTAGLFEDIQLTTTRALGSLAKILKAKVCS